VSPPSSPPKSFLSLLWNSVTATHGYLFGTLGLLLTGAAWVFPPPVHVPFPVILLLCLLATLLCTVLSHAALTAFHFMEHPLPTVRSARKPPPHYSGVHALCFLEPSDLFSHGSQVSFYLLDDGQYELLFGLGHVLTVQGNGLIQVALTRLLPGYDSTLEKLWNSDSTILKRVIIKPTVPHLDIVFPEASPS